MQQTENCDLSCYVQHTVNMVQVVEHLTSKGVPKEEALEVYVIMCIAYFGILKFSSVFYAVF